MSLCFLAVKIQTAYYLQVGLLSQCSQLFERNLSSNIHHTFIVVIYKWTHTLFISVNIKNRIYIIEKNISLPVNFYF